MWFLAKTFAFLTVCLVVTQGARAADWSEPFVAITTPREPVYLGEVYESALKDAVARVKAHVVASCPYHILASFDGLRHRVDNTPIAPKDLNVSINGQSVPVGTARVPIVSDGPTPRGGSDVPIEIRVGVRTIQCYPAGQYRGTIVITITPGY